MKVLRILLLTVLTLALVVPFAFAEKGSVKDGKALFMDRNFADGKKSCNSCHPNGRGLARAGAKKSFSIMGKTQDSLEEAVNFCIINANKGKAIDEDSREMKDIVAYIKSLGKKEAPGYGY
jgi:cytochrome c